MNEPTTYVEFLAEAREIALKNAREKGAMSERIYSESLAGSGVEQTLVITVVSEEIGPAKFVGPARRGWWRSSAAPITRNVARQRTWVYTCALPEQVVTLPLPGWTAGGWLVSKMFVSEAKAAAETYARQLAARAAGLPESRTERAHPTLVEDTSPHGCGKCAEAGFDACNAIHSGGHHFWADGGCSECGVVEPEGDCSWDGKPLVDASGVAPLGPLG